MLTPNKAFVANTLRLSTQEEEFMKRNGSLGTWKDKVIYRFGDKHDGAVPGSNPSSGQHNRKGVVDL